MIDCVFCKIINSKIPSYKIYEDDNFYACLDISQFTKGHTLVMPKKHIAFVWDFQEIDEYFKVVQKIANHFRSLRFEFVDSMTFGRQVPHAHVHLIPPNGNSKDYNKFLDSLGSMQRDVPRRLSPKDGERLAKKYRL